MTHHRRLFVCLLLAFVLVAALAGWRASADDLPPTEPPFGHTWQVDTVIPRPANGESFADPIHHRLYLAGNTQPGLDVYDSDSGARTGRIWLTPDAYAFDAAYERLTIASRPTDLDHWYVTIATYDTASLARTNSFAYHQCPEGADCTVADLAVGRAGRVYAARTSGGTIDVLSAGGAVLHSLTIHDSAAPHPPPTLAAHDDRLYVGGYFDEFAAQGLAIYDISAAVPTRLDFLPTGGETWPNVSPDGNFVTIYAFGFGAWQYRAEPFAPLWPLPAFPLGHFANGDVLTRDINGRLLALDAATGAPLRGMSEVGGFVLPLSGQRVALFGQNRVVLRRPTDYASVAPLVMNNACPGGPIIDRFTDPNSGWPIISDGPITTRYFENSYRIALRDAGLWTAVTRGDVWYRADLALALGHTLGDPLEPTGVTGFLYGLNNDWSDFYTLEISLHDHHYYHYHFHDGEWELLREGSWFGGVTGPVLVGLDRRRDTGEVVLKAGYDELYTIEEVPGRVGLIAGSFVPNVEARYTQYEFHGWNCAENGRLAAPLDVVPAAVARLHP